MKKTVNKKEFENMIAECVKEALAESRQRQQKPARKVMNEAQMQRYIQNIINEELENEGIWDGIKNGYTAAKNQVKDAMQTNGGAGFNFKGALKNAKTAYGDTRKLDRMSKDGGQYQKWAQKMIDDGMRPNTTLAQIAKSGGGISKGTYQSRLNRMTAQPFDGHERPADI